MIDRLASFLDRMAASPFVDGHRDCALTVADWVMTATRCEDPAAHLRGRYSTALGRERLLKRLGGLEAVMVECARRARLDETSTPVPGDVGLIVVGEQQLAAIRLRALWAVKSSRGCVALAADRVVKSWRVPNG
jgi:hypothetical protein